MTVYFLTVIRGDNRRCWGYSFQQGKLESILAKDYGDYSEDGFYEYAVVESSDHEGTNIRLEQEVWFQYKDGKWNQVECPEQFKKICNVAIG